TAAGTEFAYLGVARHGPPIRCPHHPPLTRLKFHSYGWRSSLCDAQPYDVVRENLTVIRISPTINSYVTEASFVTCSGTSIPGRSAGSGCGAPQPVRRGSTPAQTGSS